MASNVRFLDNVSVGSYGGGGGSSISASYALSSSHAGFATSASYADYALSASHEIIKEVSSSYADTASFAQSGNGPFTGSFTGSFIGDGTGLFSGSFSGSIPDAYQIISGSVSASISPDNGLRINSSISVDGAITGSVGITNPLTSSYAITASHALNAISSSYSLTATSASYSNNATSASYAITASHALNGGGDTFPFSGSAEITGSLIISGAGAYSLLDVGSSELGKSRLLVTDNSTKYNTFINGELYLGANGVTPQIHFGSDNTIWSMRRNGNQGLTIGNTEFNGGVDVSIYRSLEVGRFIPNSSINKLTVNGSATISGSTGLEVYGSGSTVFDVIGSEGTLLSIDDDLDGTVFTANDRTGFPILEVSASGEVWIGKSPQSLYTTAVISSTAAATTQSIFGLSTSSYDGAFFDYTVQSGSNARAGSIMSVWNGSTINFTETTTTDIGDTTDFNLIVHISQSQAQIASHATNAGYKIKTIIRSI